MRHLAGSDANLGRMPENTQRLQAFGFDVSIKTIKDVRAKQSA
jgi:hypothetical protein